MTTYSLPEAAIEGFKKANAPASTHMVECDQMEDIGSLTYVIGGKDYTLNADEWLEY